MNNIFNIVIDFRKDMADLWRYGRLSLALKVNKNLYIIV